MGAFLRVTLLIECDYQMDWRVPLDELSLPSDKDYPNIPSSMDRTKFHDVDLCPS